MQHLPTNTLLQGGKYKIERVLGQGGFGITYLATQVMLDRKVCIKEFFFKDYCNRTTAGRVTSSTDGNKDMVMRFLNKFIKEARTISRLDHPNIIRILDIFEENGTAYYVMEYIDGYSLEDKVNRQGALSENEAIGYIKQVGNALDYIHQNRINHLDVKPANIMVRRSDNKAILIDFGVSKQYDVQGGQTSTTPVGISYGYAPMEQYNPSGVSTFSSQTDIYSLGATLYKLVTGNTPPHAMEIFNMGLSGLPRSLSSNMSSAIQKAMQPRRNDRPQSLKDFMNMFSNTATCQMASSQKVSSYNSTKISNNETTVLIKPTQPKNEINGHEYVDLGLPSGLKWATCNVGANSIEETGGLYGWGNDNPNCTSEAKCYYPCNNPPQNISGTQYDVARKIMGAPWRIPTQKDFQELMDNCSLELGENNRVKGYFFISKKNSNRIFLPFCFSTNVYQNKRISMGNGDVMGSYWTANRPSFIFKDSDCSINFNISIDGRYYGHCYFWENPRCLGYAIRPVCDC